MKDVILSMFERNNPVVRLKDNWTVEVFAGGSSSKEFCVGMATYEEFYRVAAEVVMEITTWHQLLSVAAQASWRDRLIEQLEEYYSPLKAKLLDEGKRVRFSYRGSVSCYCSFSRSNYLLLQNCSPAQSQIGEPLPVIAKATFDGTEESLFEAVKKVVDTIANNFVFAYEADLLKNRLLTAAKAYYGL